MVAKREALLNEKSELEMKKLRSSQVVNKVCVELNQESALLAAYYKHVVKVQKKSHSL